VSLGQVPRDQGLVSWDRAVLALTLAFCDCSPRQLELPAFPRSWRKYFSSSGTVLLITRPFVLSRLYCFYNRKVVSLSLHPYIQPLPYHPNYPNRLSTAPPFPFPTAFRPAASLQQSTQAPYNLHTTDVQTPSNSHTTAIQEPFNRSVAG